MWFFYSYVIMTLLYNIPKFMLSVNIFYFIYKPEVDRSWQARKKHSGIVNKIYLLIDTLYVLICSTWRRTRDYY